MWNIRGFVPEWKMKTIYLCATQVVHSPSWLKALNIFPARYALPVYS